MAKKDLNKTDLINIVADSEGISKTSASAVVSLVFDSISNALKKGGSVTIPNFGSFSVTKRAARNGRNPQTGETIKIKAARVPKFKAGKGLKTAAAGKR